MKTTEDIAIISFPKGFIEKVQKEAYDQAMQDFLEKAKEFFIKKHAGMFTQFKNYMEEQQ